MLRLASITTFLNNQLARGTPEGLKTIIQTVENFAKYSYSNSYSICFDRFLVILKNPKDPLFGKTIDALAAISKYKESHNLLEKKGITSMIQKYDAEENPTNPKGIKAFLKNFGLS